MNYVWFISCLHSNSLCVYHCHSFISFLVKTIKMNSKLLSTLLFFHTAFVTVLSHEKLGTRGWVLRAMEGMILALVSEVPFGLQIGIPSAMEGVIPALESELPSGLELTSLFPSSFFLYDYINILWGYCLSNTCKKIVHTFSISCIILTNTVFFFLKKWCNNFTTCYLLLGKELLTFLTLTNNKALFHYKTKQHHNIL